MRTKPVKIRAHAVLCRSHSRLRWVSAFVAGFLICVFAASFGTVIGQQTLSPSNQSLQSLHNQFLILKTGSVYNGQIEFSGSKYIVRRSTGATIKFTSSEIDFVADSLDQAYVQLAQRIGPNDILGHQRLTNWTMKNRLTDRAQQQINRLKKLAPTSAMTRLAERQLESLTNPRPKQQLASDQTAASNQARPTGPIRELPNTQPDLASQKQLRLTLESFNETTLRTFNRSIHPKIMNGCAAARCHGNQDNPMRLWRVENRGTNSTGVRRNLHAITQYLNRENPLDSELLTYVSTVHGDMKAAAYDENSFHFYAIRDWVMSTAAMQNRNNGSISDVSQTSYLNGQDAASGESKLQTLSPSSREELATNQTDWPTLPGYESDLPSPVNLNHQKKRFVPRDEFDPAIFNRRFATESAAIRTAKSPSQSLSLQPSPTQQTPSRQPQLPENKKRAEAAVKPRASKIKSLPPLGDDVPNGN